MLDCSTDIAHVIIACGLAGKVMTSKPLLPSENRQDGTNIDQLVNQVALATKTHHLSQEYFLNKGFTKLSNLFCKHFCLDIAHMSWNMELIAF